jgi:hypothetical protein
VLDLLTSATYVEDENDLRPFPPRLLVSWVAAWVHGHDFPTPGEIAVVRRALDVLVAVGLAESIDEGTMGPLVSRPFTDEEREAEAAWQRRRLDEFHRKYGPRADPPEADDPRWTWPVGSWSLTTQRTVGPAPSPDAS